MLALEGQKYYPIETMKLLATHDAATFGEVAQHDPDTYWHRRAVRAVVLDADSRVYLMYIGRKGTYKLPGGGIDEGEDNPTALARELMEEVGVEIEVVAELGRVVEYRDFAKMKQTSYCYLARQVGEKVANNLEAGEIADGMAEMLADDIDQAIALVEDNPPSHQAGRYMQRRELTILRAAKQVIDQL